MFQNYPLRGVSKGVFVLKILVCEEVKLGFRALKGKVGKGFKKKPESFANSGFFKTPLGQHFLTYSATTENFTCFLTSLCKSISTS